MLRDFRSLRTDHFPLLRTLLIYLKGLSFVTRKKMKLPSSMAGARRGDSSLYNWRIKMPQERYVADGGMQRSSDLICIKQSDTEQDFDDAKGSRGLSTALYLLRQLFDRWYLWAQKIFSCHPKQCICVWLKKSARCTELQYLQFSQFTILVLLYDRSWSENRYA